jgi:F-type H+-transporting ATPase subunit b
MLSLDGTLIVQLVNFIVFLVILNEIFMKPVGAAIARRRAYIDGLIHGMEQLQRDAKELLGQAEARRLAARREADEAIARARVAAAQEADALIAAAQSRAGEMTKQAHAEVAREVASARSQEGRVVGVLANEMLNRALGDVA